jgi:hypothetical protein
MCSIDNVSNYIAAPQESLALTRTKDRIMKSKHFENALAILGALVILFGVSAAANIALAGDTSTVEIHGFAQN